MMIRNKINKVSTKEDLFPELSLRDKLQNRLIVFSVNIFNWIKNILLKIRNVFKLIHIYLLTRKKNWNLHRANPISIKVFITAIKIILHLDFQPMYINPTAYDSIQFKWENKYSYIKFEITQRSVKVFILLTEDVNKIKDTSISGCYSHTNYDKLNKLIKKYFL